MIAIDTSALIAVLLGEPGADACRRALEEDDLLISAATLVEAFIVAERRGVAQEMRALIRTLDVTVVTVTEASALRAARAYEIFGKGRHPAALNIGDCFAYEVASNHACPLLFVGNDFAATDVVRWI